MATEYFYQTDGRLVAHVTSLGDGNDFDIAPRDWEASVVDIDTYVAGAACDVTLLADDQGDFSTPASTITLDSFSSEGISEGNETTLMSDRANLRVTNTSGSPADFVVIGWGE